MPGDDDIIIIRHHNIAKVKVVLASIAETATDETVKAAILEAINPPPDVLNGEPSID